MFAANSVMSRFAGANASRAEIRRNFHLIFKPRTIHFISKSTQSAFLKSGTAASEDRAMTKAGPYGLHRRPIVFA
jgi:hypothetical protein